MKDLSLRLGGIILAGGESRRFGSPKALARLKDRFFIEYAIQAIEESTKDIVIISHNSIKSELNRVTTMPIIEDLPQYKGKGPLAGIATGINYLKCNWYIVLPCDTPNITKSEIMSLVKHIKLDVDAIIPVVKGRIQPLIGVYHSNVVSEIIEILESDHYKMMKLLDQLRVTYVPFEDEQPFQNINDLEEFQKLNDK
ncbi:molybdenum cofactor guanylyltransferase [Bacillus luteolus]|uniref:Probable molybdenum cofactor guanylyltransferase n=1 Tax=Litchfieldia luteola TaxID=682179 RepID=A0ABR9QLG0_9BACI|nr:molybdenum cofactor guanylyltransferase [Cytobacillus luteolus]MBE4909336.1 molybdenum cofactor guanylyltransferase [Cytobacillus luteolus]MBP1940732.1 molybdopterin-guanine dinucleotide biosynthesis protein A [Cytobacillus luteolus]